MKPQLRAALIRERRVKVIAVLAIIVVGITILLTVDNLLIAVILAIVAHYLLSPVVNYLESHRVPRQLAILIPFFSAGALIALAVSIVLPMFTSQLTSLESKLPHYQVELVNLISSFEGNYKSFFSYYHVSLGQTINTWILERTGRISLALPSVISGSMTVLLLAPIFAYFMLQDGQRISHGLLGLVPNNFFELALNLEYQLNEQLGGFIRARFIEAAIVGVVVWLGLQALGFPYASVLGVFAGLTNLIPYIGPVIGAVPAMLIALISDDAQIAHTLVVSLALVTAVYLVAQLIDMIFVIPLVVARIVNLHPLTVIIVIIVGAQVMGIVGMVISIPVASAGKLIFQTLYKHLVEFRAPE